MASWAAGRRAILAVAIVVGAAAGVVLLSAAPAFAHALPQSSDPSPGATLKQAPTTVSITFGEIPDPRLSLIQVLDSTGQNDTTGKTEPLPGDPKTLAVPVGHLGTGVYTVSWRTVSEVDGHLAGGTFAFGVGVTPTGAVTGTFATKSRSPSLSSVVSRWLLYVGLMGMVGAVFLGVVCYRELPHRLTLLVAGGWVIGLVGAVGITVDARRAAHLAWSSLIGSSLGRQLLWRAVPLLVGAVPLAFALVATREGKAPTKRVVAALVVTGVSGLAAMWGDVESSHADASRTWRLARLFDQFAHFAAAGLWVGGLAVLLLTLGAIDPSRRVRAARRYSFTALLSVAVIAVTGFERAYDEVGALHRLVDTAFGQYIDLKIGLLAILVGLGAYNRYRSIPSLAESPRRLQRVGRVELVALSGLLLATAILQGLAPPTTVAQGTVRPLVLTGADFGTTVKVKLTITPDTAGFNLFTLTAADYDSGAAVNDATASLAFDLPSQPSLGSSTLALKTIGPGRYQANGANLSIDGTWSITLTIQRPGGGVQIPFTVTPRVPPVKLVVTPEPSGIPTLYTLELSAGRSVQNYLDPARPGGINEFHATFIGTGGQEIPMAAFNVTAAGPSIPASTPLNLTTRRLDTIGHFVADLPGAVKGTYRFHYHGTTTGGTIIDETVSIPVT